MQKNIGILHIHKEEFKLQTVPLQTVRPFVFDNISLSDIELKKNYSKKQSELLYEYIKDYIENTLIPKAAKQITGLILTIFNFWLRKSNEFVEV